jgi:hypothetical protein
MHNNVATANNLADRLERYCVYNQGKKGTPNEWKLEPGISKHYGRF